MLAYPQAYIDYLIYFHAERDFFECHEIMEEYWKSRPNDEQASNYVGLIQVAVSMYHARRGNKIGAVKMLTQALSNFTDEGVLKLGLDPVILRELLAKRLQGMNAADWTYSDLSLPISDPQLHSLCLQFCNERKLSWECVSNLGDLYLIHKHTRRDRSAVIAERERSREQKARLRGKKHE